MAIQLYLNYIFKIRFVKNVLYYIYIISIKNKKKEITTKCQKYVRKCYYVLTNTIICVLNFLPYIEDIK